MFIRSVAVAGALTALAAVPVFAQLPQDSLRAKAYSANTVRQKFVTENPTAVEENRTEHSAHYRVAGARVALISQFLHWYDPETGQMVPVEPALWNLDNGWRLEGVPVKARIVRNGTTWTFESYHQRSDKQWRTISLAIAEPTHGQGLSFSFSHQKLTWKLRLHETGFEISAEVTAKQGRQVYSFQQTAHLLDLSVDQATGDLLGNGFRLTRAMMVRADRVLTPCSAWSLDGANVSFTCDDSDFPPQAFPYVIDPSGSFYPTAGGDDGWAEIANYSLFSCPAWTGGLAVDYVYGTTTAVNTVRSRSSYSNPICYKYSDQGYVRFDTSSIPSGSTVTGASVSVNASTVQDGNQQLQGGSGCSVQADWYASSNWPLNYSEWNLWGSGNAVSPQDLTGRAVGWNTFGLANLSNIPVGAGAYAGLKWSVPCDPYVNAAGNDVLNEFSFYSFDNGASTKPYMTISYTDPAAQHVITSSPTGRSLTVDGVGCTSPCTFSWTAGSTHTIAATTPQAGPTGTQYVFANWSDGGAMSHSVTASSSPATYTANFTTQYYRTAVANPPAGGTISPASAWHNSGAVVSVSAAANSGYQFSGFTGALGGTTTPQNLTMNAPKSVTANFGGVQHVITSTPTGRSLTVDGAGCTSPCTFFWTAGTAHTIATTTPQSGGSGTQYVYTIWSDGGAVSHSITASSSPATYTANFTTQYWLTTTAGAGGTISPASSWRNSGVDVAVSAAASTGYQFSGFSGDLIGTTTPQNLTMNTPKSVTASFTSLAVPHLITTLPVGLSLTVDGGNCVSPCTLYWLPGTNHTIATTTPQSGAGTQYVFTSWSDGGAQSHSIVASSSPPTYTASFATQYTTLQALNGCISTPDNTICTLAPGTYSVSASTGSILVGRSNVTVTGGSGDRAQTKLVRDQFFTGPLIRIDAPTFTAPGITLQNLTVCGGLNSIRDIRTHMDVDLGASQVGCPRQQTTPGFTSASCGDMLRRITYNLEYAQAAPPSDFQCTDVEVARAATGQYPANPFPSTNDYSLTIANYSGPRISDQAIG